MNERARGKERERETRNEIQDAVWTFRNINILDARALSDNTYIMTGPGARPRYKSRSCYSRERKAGRIAWDAGRARLSLRRGANAIPLGDLCG